jgi:hypothetical protein
MESSHSCLRRYPVGNWRVVYAADVTAEAIAADVRYLLTE